MKKKLNNIKIFEYILPFVFSILVPILIGILYYYNKSGMDEKTVYDFSSVLIPTNFAILALSIPIYLKLADEMRKQLKEASEKIKNKDDNSENLEYYIGVQNIINKKLICYLAISSIMSIASFIFIMLSNKSIVCFNTVGIISFLSIAAFFIAMIKNIFTLYKTLEF